LTIWLQNEDGEPECAGGASVKSKEAQKALPEGRHFEFGPVVTRPEKKLSALG